MGWFDRWVNSEIDKAIDKKIDKEIDAYLEPKIGSKHLRRVKKLAKKGRPLDADTEELLLEFMSEVQLEEYRKIHNDLVQLEQLDKDISDIEKFL